MNQYTWKRREFTTRSSDPTVVVEWQRNDGVVLQEFQNIITVLGAVKSLPQTYTAHEATKMFQELENKFQEEREN